MAWMFGLGWYGDHGEPGLYREVRPAWSYENLRDLRRYIRSHFFSRMSAPPRHADDVAELPSVRASALMFMHNGQIGDWTLIRRKVEAMIRDAYHSSRIGTTDLEAVFLAILGAGADFDPLLATVQTLHHLTELVKASGTPEPLRFTASLSDGRNLDAFRYVYNAKSNTLYYREAAGSVVVASELLDTERDFWNWCRTIMS